MDQVGKRISKLREKKQKTVSEVAKAIGVPASTYREWEYGRSIRAEFYIPLSHVLGVSVYELLTGDRPSRNDILSKLNEAERIILTLKNEIGSWVF